MNTLAFAAALLLAPPGDGRDRTGIEWALPFKTAHQRASEQKRLLLIKPIAFGTSKDGGW